VNQFLTETLLAMVGTQGEGTPFRGNPAALIDAIKG
jgi:hypothetical protein